MKDKKILIKLVGIIGGCLALAATMLNDYSTKQELKMYIDKKMSEEEE